MAGVLQALEVVFTSLQAGAVEVVANMRVRAERMAVAVDRTLHPSEPLLPEAPCWPAGW